MLTCYKCVSCKLIKRRMEPLYLLLSCRFVRSLFLFCVISDLVSRLYLIRLVFSSSGSFVCNFLFRFFATFFIILPPFIFSYLSFFLVCLFFFSLFFGGWVGGCLFFFSFLFFLLLFFSTFFFTLGFTSFFQLAWDVLVKMFDCLRQRCFKAPFVSVCMRIFLKF